MYDASGSDGKAGKRLFSNGSRVHSLRVRVPPAATPGYGVGPILSYGAGEEKGRQPTTDAFFSHQHVIGGEARLCGRIYMNVSLLIGRQTQKNTFFWQRRSITSARMFRSATDQLAEPFALAHSTTEDDIKSRATTGSEPSQKPPRPQALPGPRRLLYNLSPLQTEAPAAFTFWTENFGDATVVVIPLFRVALANSGRRHDIPIHDASKRMSARKFRSWVLGTGPLADMFAIASESGMTEIHMRTSFNNNAMKTNAELSEAKGSGDGGQSQLHDNLVLLRTQAPTAYAFWTEYFGDDLSVTITLFRVALASSGRRDDIRFEARNMSTRVFRTFVLGSGPLADMFASAPESGDPISATFDGTNDVDDTATGYNNLPLTGLLTSPDLPRTVIAVNSDPSSGVLREGSHLVSRSMTCENFRATLDLIVGKLALSVPRKVTPMWFRKMVQQDPLARAFSAVGASERSGAEEYSDERLVLEAHRTSSCEPLLESKPSLHSDFNRKVAPGRLTFRDELEILSIENPAAHRFWISNFRYARISSRTNLRDALRLLGSQIELKSHIGGKGDITPSAFRKMIVHDEYLAAAFPSSEPQLPQLLTRDQSPSSGVGIPEENKSRESRSAQVRFQDAEMDEYKPLSLIDSGSPIRATKLSSTGLQPWTQAFGQGWATIIKHISTACRQSAHPSREFTQDVETRLK
ncbi:hypothetical protein BDK51DRAFT_28150, partial [Blyttiomyces helicus]